MHTHPHAYTLTHAKLTRNPLVVLSQMARTRLAAMLLVCCLAGHSVLGNNTCADPACTADPATTCDEEYQDAVSSIETQQHALEQDASQLLSLSDGVTEPAAFLSQAASISSQAANLQAATQSTLQELNVGALSSAQVSAATEKNQVSSIAASLTASASSMEQAFLSIEQGLSSLNQATADATESASDASATICPAGVPDADNFHFSGHIDTASGGYGSFQLETGVVDNDMLVTFQSQGSGDAAGANTSTSDSAFVP